MKLRFKVQPYQTNAVIDVVDCFAGQPMTAGLSYRITPAARRRRAPSGKASGTPTSR